MGPISLLKLFSYFMMPGLIAPPPSLPPVSVRRPSDAGESADPNAPTAGPTASSPDPSNIATASGHTPPPDPALGPTIVTLPPDQTDLSFAGFSIAMAEAVTTAIHDAFEHMPPPPRRYSATEFRSARLRRRVFEGTSIIGGGHHAAPRPITTFAALSPPLRRPFAATTAPPPPYAGAPFTAPTATASPTFATFIADPPAPPGTFAPATAPSATASPPPSPPPFHFAGPKSSFNPLFTPTAAIATPATSPFAANKLADLPKFTGTEPNTGLAFDRWLQTITSHFALFPAFFDDGNRVSAAIQCLGGPAQDWVRVNAPSPFTPNCWANFIATLEATFAPLDRSLAARAELASCHQIGTAQDYLLRFNLASAPITNLHPAEKFERFKEGLKHNIRRSMMVDHPEIIDFASAAAYAVRYDMLSSATTTTPPPAPRPAAPYRPPPARLNAVTSPAPASTTTRPRAPITPEERAHIVAVGGCTYCRNVLPPLHLLEACPTRPARPAYLLGNGRSQ